MGLSGRHQRKTTAPPHPWAAPPPSWIFTSSANLRRRRARRTRRPGADRPIHHQSCVWSATCSTPEYNELFGGDPTWVTESIGGMGVDGRTHGHKEPPSAILHTPDEPGHRSRTEPHRALEPRLCRKAFKAYCARMSIATDSIQYENDDIMRPMYGDDYWHCLLRIRHGCRQADAVLRRTGQPGQEPAATPSTAVWTRSRASRSFPILQQDQDEILDYSKVLGKL